MKRYLLFLILGLVVFSGCEDKDTIVLPGTQQNQMRVVGTATITKAPDIAISQIGVQTIKEEVDPAIAENNRKVDAIISALRGLGVEEKDIQTTSFNIYPLRDYQNNKPNVIIGFQVDNMVSVTFRKIDVIGKGLQAAINAGANNINGVSFTFSDPESLKREARVIAIQDARERAKSMADAAGIKLGKIISLNDYSQSSTVITRSYDKAAAEAAVPIQPGELDLVVQVELIYVIL